MKNIFKTLTLATLVATYSCKTYYYQNANDERIKATVHRELENMISLNDSSMKLVNLDTKSAILMKKDNNKKTNDGKVNIIGISYPDFPYRILGVRIDYAIIYLDKQKYSSKLDSINIATNEVWSEVVNNIKHTNRDELTRKSINKKTQKTHYHNLNKEIKSYTPRKNF
jgi:hypothetical protein